MNRLPEQSTKYTVKNAWEAFKPATFQDIRTAYFKFTPDIYLKAIVTVGYKNITTRVLELKYRNLTLTKDITWVQSKLLFFMAEFTNHKRRYSVFIPEPWTVDKYLDNLAGIVLATYWGRGHEPYPSWIDKDIADLPEYEGHWQERKVYEKTN